MALAEVYDEASNTFTPLEMPGGGRVGHAGVVDPESGRMLIIGGADAHGAPLSTIIVFDPKRQSFSDDGTDGFHAVNLSALSSALIESELFGHRRGAFTGAVEDHAGWFEKCKPLGAVFLDEIGELPLEMQAKLLLVNREPSCRRSRQNRPALSKNT